MRANIEFNVYAATHQWPTIVTDDEDKFLFGVALDALTHEEANMKINALMTKYSNDRSHHSRPPRR